MKRILEVQKEIGVLGKDSKNPFFKSAYLDLNKLLIHVTPLMHKHGLILMQPIKDGEVQSIILDAENGNVLAQSGIQLPTLNDPQKLGSAITYFRRYTLKSLLSIAEGDDDANLASAPEPIDYAKGLKDAKTLVELSKAWVSIPNKTDDLVKLKDKLKGGLK